MSKAISFQGSKFYIGNGTEAEKNITACATSKPATITVANSGVKRGDLVKVSGLGSLDGYYPVKSVSTDTITFADEVDWGSYDKPTDFSQARMAKVRWSSNFCLLEQLEKDGDTLNEEDVTTMCSEGIETEPGEIEFGSVKLTFYFKPKTEIQMNLRNKFYNKETFPYLLVLKNEQGSFYSTGFLQTGMNFSGEVKGNYKSSVTIKPTKRDYWLPTA